VTSLLLEEDLLPLSALSHLVFCERRCALVHIEQIWQENQFTLEGSHLHDRTHDSGPRREVRGDLVICRGLPLRSLRLGVSGIADVVEFHRAAAPLPGASPGDARPAAVALPGLPGAWSPFPVEYKRGKPKPDRCDEVQVCAQAICLEEMLGVSVAEGALFYGATQHRHGVRFDAELRAATEQAAQRLHELVREQLTPRVPRQPKCKRCSLLDVCRPDATGPRRSARRYLTEAFARATGEEVEQA
jgi:CRISPR-associated exonuclease Cas4